MQELIQIAQKIADRGRGILAADESHGTIEKRFATINVTNNEENRRAYRDMLFRTKGLGQYICGVILFEETLTQKSHDGVLFPELLKSQKMIPGIKVDKGLIPLENSLNEKVTQGLDGLPERLEVYKQQGAQFAKWRATFDIDDVRPSLLAIRANAENLARYAAICQAQGIVPIVEPELLMDGSNTIERCEEATEMVLHKVFNALFKNKVCLEGMVLKPSMVISGKQCAKQANVEAVADATVRILLRTVPAAVPTINFLSGGQSAEVATAHLNAMHARHPHLPWNLSFSYGRALQDPALKAWQGKAENVEAAQAQLLKRAKLNSHACMGEYNSGME
ncbi:MAG: class I fructose-bisphosphate aldolase [Gammaproteobacteria bacterium]